MKIAIYPGSFDPATLGHLDVIKRASKIFDKVIVAVLVNSEKKPMFTNEEKHEILRLTTQGIDNVEIMCFKGLLVDFAEKVGATAIIKGLRAMSDFDYEFQMALANKKLCQEVDTVFLMTSDKYMYLSSSLVRDIAKYGGDISQFVHHDSIAKIKEKYESEEK